MDPGIRTLGFAGFFGLPTAHRQLASDIEERRLPVLLNPGLQTCAGGPAVARADQTARAAAHSRRAWGRFRQAAVSSFAFAEATGLLYLGKLVSDSLGLTRTPGEPAPRLDPALDLTSRVRDRIECPARDVADNGFRPDRAARRPRGECRQQSSRERAALRGVRGVFRRGERPVAGAASQRHGGPDRAPKTRPEWGLAGYSAFIAAPRHRTAGRPLGGRAFLHEYDWRQDTGFGVLELILTAPVVVASWICLQYYGSTAAPELFGCGNKLLHNVTGRIGVLDGNSGPLRGGLAEQSVHDGERYAHEPLRLSVCIEAPREAITDILNRHAAVRALFDNRWLHLFALDAEGRMAWRYAGDLRWTSTAGSPAVASGSSLRAAV